MSRPQRMADVTRFAALLVGTLMLGSACLDAHVFWIAVNALRLRPAETAAFAVGFGEQFPVPNLLPEAREVPIRVFSPSGSAIPLRERSQITPEGLLTGRFPTSTEPGVYVVDASLYTKAVDYTAADFQNYLARERLTSALSYRKALREEDHEAREILTMFAKAFVRVGTGGWLPKPIGTRVELVPLADPTTLRVGATCRFRALYLGGRLANVVITASSGADPNAIQTFRTYSDGEVDFIFPKAGVWLIRAVHMIPRPVLAEGVTEWASYWASLTLNVAPR